MYAFTDDRCYDCDGRYCYGVCKRTETTVWVNGFGWAEPKKARALEAAGRTVQWPVSA